MNNPGVVVPPAPEKNPFGRFDDTFVQQRRLALEKCIQKTANHPVLSKDPDLKLFLESDTFSLDVSPLSAQILFHLVVLIIPFFRLNSERPRLLMNEVV
jgi:sorting nexin-1/2